MVPGQRFALPKSPRYQINREGHPITKDGAGTFLGYVLFFAFQRFSPVLFSAPAKFDWNNKQLELIISVFTILQA
jgi:hypothetical protein